MAGQPEKQQIFSPRNKIHSEEISEQKKIRNDARVINVCSCKVIWKAWCAETLWWRNKGSVYWTEQLYVSLHNFLQFFRKQKNLNLPFRTLTNNLFAIVLPDTGIQMILAHEKVIVT